jgi:polar amino acid transport system substrate-binding protein
MKKWLSLWTCLFCVSVNLNAADDSDFSFTGAELAPHSGQALPQKGWVPQVINEALKGSGYRVDFQFLPFNRALVSVRKGQIDAMSPLYISESRKAFLYFSEPLVVSKTALFYTKEKPVNFRQISDLYGLKIAIMRGASVNPEFDKYQQMIRIEVTSYDQLVRMLLLGRVDALVGEEFVVREIIKNDREFNGKHRLLQGEVALATQGLYVAVSRAAPDAANKFKALNVGLSRLKVSGRFNQILLQHGIVYDNDVIKPVVAPLDDIMLAR